MRYSANVEEKAEGASWKQSLRLRRLSQSGQPERLGLLLFRGSLSNFESGLDQRFAMHALQGAFKGFDKQLTH
jgi:hypothetical protein